MSRQSHDPGNRKRRARERAAEQRTTSATPAQYARDLVRRGLASKNVLDGADRRPAPHGEEQ